MAGLNMDQHMAVRGYRLGHLNQVFTIMFATAIANTIVVLSFGPGASAAGRLAIAVVIVAATLYSSLATRSAMVELDAMRKDAADTLAGSHFGSFAAGVQVGLFIRLTIGLNVLIALTQLLALYAS